MFSSKFRNIFYAIRKICEAKQKTSKINLFSSSSVKKMSEPKSSANILEFLELVGNLKVSFPFTFTDSFLVVFYFDIVVKN